MIWLDGEWVEAAALPVSDRGFLLGDGLFETLRWSGGRIPRLDYHQARMRRSADMMGLPDPFDGVSLEALAAQFEGDDLVLRFSISTGEGARGLARPGRPCIRRLLTASPRSAPPTALRLVTVKPRRSASALTSGHKTLSYADNVHARRIAEAQGGDMALVLDTDGRLSGADCANLFWFADGRWETPSEACGALPGTVRAHILAAGHAETDARGPNGLARAEQVAVTNAVMGVVPVSHLDGVALPQNPDALKTLRTVAG